MAGGFLVLPGQGDGLRGSHPTSPLAPGLGDISEMLLPCALWQFPLSTSIISYPSSSSAGSRRKALLLLTLGLALKGLQAVSQPGCKPRWHVPTGSPKGGLFLPAPSMWGPCWDQVPWDQIQCWSFCPFSSK